MASYDLVERLNDTFRQLERELQTLRGSLSQCRLLAARVFELPPVSKDAEHQPLDSITVVQHTGKTALEMALRHYSHLFIQNASANVNGWCGGTQSGAGSQACVSSRTNGSANFKSSANILGLQYTYKF